MSASTQETAAPAATRVTVETTVVATTPGGCPEQITGSQQTLTTNGDPFRAADAAVTAVKRDITRGWAGNWQTDGFNPQASVWDAPGTAKVTFTVTIGDESEEFFTIAETTGSLTRSIIQAAHSVADDADAWIQKKSRTARGMSW